jgi:hypothetical protein
MGGEWLQTVSFPCTVREMLLIYIFINSIKNLLFILKFLSLYSKQALAQCKKQLYLSVLKGSDHYTVGTPEVLDFVHHPVL